MKSVLIGLALTLGAASLAQAGPPDREHRGKEQGFERDERERQKVREREDDYEYGRETDLRQDRGPDWKRAGGLPPGLQKKVDRGEPLPPGWQKKLEPGDRMPPDYGRYGEVEREDGRYDRVEVDDRVFKVIRDTGVIVDILRDY